MSSLYVSRMRRFGANATGIFSQKFAPLRVDEVTSLGVKSVAILFVSFVGSICVATEVSAPLCTAQESVVFSCTTDKLKVIALCLNETNPLLFYRYGKLGRVEFSYSRRPDSKSGFLFNQYFRYRFDYKRIYFVMGGYEYSVYRRYDADQKPNPDYGLIVSENGDEKAKVACQSHVIDNMSKAINILRCDENSALGCN
ncbi:hypothetical protein [Burkholderia sp. Ac-20365]|uniref:hypothetical protein n=1 Tax=Burkholderia sp. Ac-20365 TaxID=2703897 RepID=UPI00197C691E|nr:hypothetical protein [Burkholderia sp. Ac-20365]MBN3759473.1 hypothetical protein [Burkholderia sp. Ac-20365]